MYVGVHVCTGMLLYMYDCGRAQTCTCLHILVCVSYSFSVSLSLSLSLSLSPSLSLSVCVCAPGSVSWLYVNTWERRPGAVSLLCGRPRRALLLPASAPIKKRDKTLEALIRPREPAGGERGPTAR